MSTTRVSSTMNEDSSISTTSDTLLPTDPKLFSVHDLTRILASAPHAVVDEAIRNAGHDLESGFHLIRAEIHAIMNVLREIEQRQVSSSGFAWSTLLELAPDKYRWMAIFGFIISGILSGKLTMTSIIEFYSGEDTETLRDTVNSFRSLYSSAESSRYAAFSSATGLSDLLQSQVGQTIPLVELILPLEAILRNLVDAGVFHGQSEIELNRLLNLII